LYSLLLMNPISAILLMMGSKCFFDFYRKGWTMRFLFRVVVCILLLVGLAAAESMLIQPGPEGKDAEIDNKQGSSPHGSFPYIFMPVGG
jgi:hypothetical protein